MRLINVITYELHDFVTDHQPRYAILSHTWGDGEVTFPEMKARDPATKLKTGFRKIEYTCQEAQLAGLDWAWVDTCCIDKSSSSELSESINSMFRWYQQSAVCYVYLADLDDCRWFERGWCLQELLAPTVILFFSRGWVRLQQINTLTYFISSVTGIEEEYLRHERDLSEASVAKRMSWAASRQCTRDEDVAYCLMGIFDINMPLLYGEGKKAFRRLQEEIWNEVEDHSLLAWSVTEDDPRAWAQSGVFAESPADFRFSGDVCWPPPLKHDATRDGP
ncbi:heterokaryon incompatibility protein-domain-containing protein [Plectosphaerella plurivora]|uniref:Heterokaryon incompatibility protein-domain-containing protein n=1 Tax=Plectosphaerella plurivora TaxID=936078 RepID=A0A9P8V678_9PEZI|nr:heterokaryon incompatibility protein-domain-containing protein [Plectosphaerella plurivora]